MDVFTLVDRLDSGEIAPTYHVVVRAICAHIELEDADRALLARIDRRKISDGEALQQGLWDRIESHSVEREAIPRLLNILLMPDEPMDWFGAEMVIHWALQEGVIEAQLFDAFGVPLPAGR